MSKSTRLIEFFKKNMTTITVLLIIYALLILVFSLLTPYFLSIRNLFNIGQYASVLGLIAIGMTIVILSGGLDISVGSIVAVTGMIVATTFPENGSVILMIALGLAIGLVCGSINGFLIAYAKITPIITTLATMSIFRGVAYLWTDSISVFIVNDNFKWIGRGYLGVFPIPLILMLLVFLVFWGILKYSGFGRKVYAIGGNAQACYLSGIIVRRVQLKIYIVCGVLSGLAGTMLASQTSSGLPQAGLRIEMDIIAAVVLGGTTLAGGKGHVFGSLIGVLILATLGNGLTLLNVPSFWQLIVKGFVLLFAIVLDVVRSRGYSRTAYMK